MMPAAAPTTPRGIRRLTSRVTGAAPFFPIFVLFGLNCVDELDRTAFGILVPEIRDAFGLDLAGVLGVEALVSLAVLLFTVPLGHWADRTNRVRLAAGGAAGWAFFSVLTGLAGSIAVLMVARSGAGFGRAVVEPTHNSLVADYYPVEVRTKVFGFHRAANSTGRLVGPLSAGIIAYFLGWRAPFVIFGIPTLLFVLLSMRLREPKRGRYERQSAGASFDTIQTEEDPPSFAEARRILWQVRSLRRIWFCLPFLFGSIIGAGSLLALYFDEEFGLNEVERGFTFAAAEGAGIIGLSIGIPIATRLALRDPGLLLKFIGIVSVVIAGAFGIIAVAPNLPVAIGTLVVITGGGAVLVPGVYAALSLAIPPKVRSLGFSLGALWVIPGLLVLPIIGAIADEVGIRRGILFLVPLYFVGAVILFTSGRFMRGDITKVWSASAAQSEVRLDRLRGDPKILVCRGVDVAYGSTQVLFEVDFDVKDGEIVALLGTNGAGKSTLLKAISGSVEPSAGVIIYDGRDITLSPANETVEAGLVIVPGGRGIFPGLTVAENFGLAGWIYNKEPDHIQRATEQALEYFPVLRERWHLKAGNLSGGEQQMLTLAQAFIARPRLLMIDELSLGLAPLVVEKLLDVVRAIHESGTTVILVEQSVNVALTLAKRAVFIEKGEIRFNGPTEELLSRPDILRSVFLEGAASVMEVQRGDAPGNGKRTKVEVRETRDFSDAPEVLAVAGLSVSFGGIRAVNDVTFGVREKQILGLIGPNGAGKTTIFDLISGYLPPDGGRITILGEDITRRPPHGRAIRGLGRSFQDARLFPSMTVREVISVALERHIAVRDPIAAALGSPRTRIAEEQVRARADELIELMHLKAFGDKFVSELSTGSRRIVDLACCVAHDPKVLLLDEPSSGIAQRETEALGPLLLDIRDKTDAALIVIEHDMPLITGISDEIIALDLGVIIAWGTPHEVVNHPSVVASYLGTSEEAIQRSGAVAGTLGTGHEYESQLLTLAREHHEEEQAGQDPMASFRPDSEDETNPPTTRRHRTE